MSLEKKVPEIRFKGFSGGWANLVLGENARFTKGQGYSKGDLVTSGTPIILYGRLYTRYQTVINGVDTFVNEKVKPIKSIGGEVIVPASGESPEDISRASVVNDQNVILGGDLNVIYPNRKIDPIFLALAISNGSIKKELSSKAQGKSVVHIRNSDLADLRLILPSDNQEQTQIGNTFQKLDSLINQHQQKHDQLSNVKKAMLGKMFPKPGETIPEIRFKGFSGEWRRFTLGEIGSVAMNKRIFKEETSPAGDIPFFKIGTFGDKPDAFISKNLFDEYRAKYPYPEAGDLLLSASGSIGRVVEYKGAEQYFQDSNIVWLKHDGKINNSFLKVFYSIVKWSGLEGSTIKRLYNKNILETKIFLPAREEQSLIGNYFQKLDALINQHQQQISKLTHIKQSFLSKMFV